MNLPTDFARVAGTERLWFTVGGGIVFQRLETDDGFDADLPQTGSTAGRSRLQGAGLHPPPLGEPMRSWMLSTEQDGVYDFSPADAGKMSARYSH